MRTVGFIVLVLMGFSSHKIVLGESSVQEGQGSQSLVFPPPLDLERELESLTHPRDVEFEAALRLTEEDLPVLTDEPNRALVESSTYTRLVISLGIVFAVTGVIVLGGRRWMSRAQQGDAVTKIRLLTQLPLGPKRSVAVITVAGESLLIGVTDHNISLLRDLSLLDEEIPESVPREFGQTLENSLESDRQEPRPSMGEAEEEFKVSSVREMVADRLKKMRPL